MSAFDKKLPLTAVSSPEQTPCATVRKKAGATRFRIGGYDGQTRSLRAVKSQARQDSEVSAFLRSALPLVQEEPGTLNWYAVESAPGQYAIFDTFDSEEDRQAHLDGKVAAALMEKASELFSEPPQINKLTILAAK